MGQCPSNFEGRNSQTLDELPCFDDPCLREGGVGSADIRPVLPVFSPAAFPLNRLAVPDEQDNFATQNRMASPIVNYFAEKWPRNTTKERFYPRKTQRGKPQRVSWSSRDRYRYRYSLSKKPDRIDSESRYRWRTSTLWK